MEKPDYKKESIFWLLLVIPFIYAGYYYNALPEQVAIHFDISGEPNGWGNKILVFLMPVLNIAIYGFLYFAPGLDPKKRNYESFAPIFYKIRLVVAFFLCVLTFLIIRASLVGKLGFDGRWVVSTVTLMLALLGNFMINIKPNWFIGIRTPWTLSSDTVWKKTHLVGGRLFFYGGLLCFASSFFLASKILAPLLMVFTIGSAVFIFVYSLWLFKKEEKEKMTGSH